MLLFLVRCDVAVTVTFTAGMTWQSKTPGYSFLTKAGGYGAASPREEEKGYKDKSIAGPYMQDSGTLC